MTRLLDAGRPADLVLAATIVREGGVIVVPTDTVYGIAADIFHQDAVERVFEVKGREEAKQLPVLLSTARDLDLLVPEVPRLGWQLIERFWPGPLTLVLPCRHTLPPWLTRGGRTVASRVPAARECLQFLQALGAPVVGTSANRSGDPPAVTAAQVVESLGGRVDAILQADAAVRAGIASTVVELRDGRCLVHRVGSVTPDDLRAAAGPSVAVEVQLTAAGNGGYHRPTGMDEEE